MSVVDHLLACCWDDRGAGARGLVGAGETVAATTFATSGSVSGAAADRRSGGAGRDCVRAQDRDHLARTSARSRRMLRGDLLASVAGLDRVRGLRSGARVAAGPATGSGPARSGYRRGGRFARAGAQRGAATGPSPVDRARPGTKHHVITEGAGIPLAVTVTGGNRHDSTQLIPLIEALPTIRGKRGRPWQRPRWLYGDRGYDYDHHRKTLRDRGIVPRIARRNIDHGSGLGTVRWVVERTFAWLHQFKRLRTRYERRADIHLGLLQLGCVLICYRQLPTSF